VLCACVRMYVLLCFAGALRRGQLGQISCLDSQSWRVWLACTNTHSCSRAATQACSFAFSANRFSRSFAIKPSGSIHLCVAISSCSSSLSTLHETKRQRSAQSASGNGRRAVVVRT
jgi:hypothetical protein